MAKRCNLFYGRLSKSEKAEVTKFMDNNIISSCERVVLFLKEQYVYKYTKNVPSKMNIEQQEQFKLFYDEVIKKMPKNQVLLFGDSVHPASLYRKYSIAYNLAALNFWHFQKIKSKMYL
jgi:hypothetical protein